MDKYEYNLKLDEIKALVGKQDYAGAASICDTIEWRKVRSNNTLNMVADAYEATKQYDKAKNVLLIAYERTPLGRQLAYRLTILSIKEKNFEEAEEFYEDFLEVSPRDMAKYLLQYQLAKAKGTDIDVLIGILEKYSQEDVDERWQYELAVLYHRAGYKDKCIALCDEMILWFGDGKYVEKALELKMLYEPLTKSQQEKYNKQQEEKAQREAQAKLRNTQSVPPVRSVKNAQPIRPTQDAQQIQQTQQLQQTQHMQGLTHASDFQNTQTIPVQAQQPQSYTDVKPQTSMLDNSARKTADREYRLNANGSIVSKASGSGDVSDVVPAEMLREKLEEQEREAAKREEEKKQEIKRVVAERMAQQEAATKKKSDFKENLPKVSEVHIKAAIDTVNENMKQNQVTEQSVIQQEPEAVSEVYAAEPKPEISLKAEKIEPVEEPVSEVYIAEPEAEISVKEEKIEPMSKPVSEVYIAEPEAEISVKEEKTEPMSEPVSEVYIVEPETEIPVKEEKTEPVEKPVSDAYIVEPKPERIYRDEENIEPIENTEQQETGLPQKTDYREEQKEQAESTKEEEMLNGSTGELVENLGHKIRANAIQEEYNRVNLQEEIAKSMASILGNLQLVHEDEEEEEEPEITTTKRIPEIKEDAMGDTQRIADISQIKDKLQPMNAMSEQPQEDEQIEGQLSLEDVMAQFENESQDNVEKKEKGESISYFTRPIFGEEFTTGIKEALGEDAPIQGEMMQNMEAPEDLKEESQNMVTEDMVTEEYLEQMEPTEQMEEEEYQAPVFNVQSFRDMEKAEVQQEEEIQPQKESIKLQQEEIQQQLSAAESAATYEPNKDAAESTIEEDTTEEDNHEYNYGESGKIEIEIREKEEPERYSRQDTGGQLEHSRLEEYSQPYAEEQAEYEPTEQFDALGQESDMESEDAAVNPQDLLQTAENAFENWFDKTKAPTAMEEPTRPQNEREEYHGEPALEKMRQKKEEKKNKNKGKKRIPEDKRGAFASFLEIKDLEEQIALTLENLSYHSSNDGTSSTNNVMIAGEAKSGKTTLALEVIKTSNKDRSRTGRKVAKVKGTTLNKRGIKNVMAKLLGTDLIIEQAGSLMPQQVSELIDTLNGYTGNMLVVLEDDKVAIDRLVELHPKLEVMFSNQIVIKEYDINEWVRIAKEYAQSQDYGVDEMGTLALYAKINDVYGKKKEIEKSDVQMIIDDAIKHSEKKNIGKLFEIVFSRKYKDSDLTMLRESDFQ